MSNTQKIEALRKKAQNTEDPEKLHKIARAFQALGAWDDQYEAESKAHRNEQALAEAAAR